MYYMFCLKTIVISFSQNSYSFYINNLRRINPVKTQKSKERKSFYLKQNEEEKNKKSKSKIRTSRRQPKCMPVSFDHSVVERQRVSLLSVCLCEREDKILRPTTTYSVIKTEKKKKKSIISETKR